MLKGLTHVALAVTDLQKSIDFYTSIPGIEEQFRFLHDDGSVRLVYLKIAQRQFIELFPSAESPCRRSTDAGCVHFSMEVDDAGETYNLLRNRGITFKTESILELEDFRMFVVEDPDGIAVEFQEFTPNSVATRER